MRMWPTEKKISRRSKKRRLKRRRKRRKRNAVKERNENRLGEKKSLASNNHKNKSHGNEFLKAKVIDATIFTLPQTVYLFTQVFIKLCRNSLSRNDVKYERKTKHIQFLIIIIFAGKVINVANKYVKMRLDSLIPWSATDNRGAIVLAFRFLCSYGNRSVSKWATPLGSWYGTIAAAGASISALALPYDCWPLVPIGSVSFFYPATSQGTFRLIGFPRARFDDCWIRACLNGSW